eukprot:3215317-Prymnesium_polylepis.2
MVTCAPLIWSTTSSSTASACHGRPRTRPTYIPHHAHAAHTHRARCADVPRRARAIHRTAYVSNRPQRAHITPRAHHVLYITSTSRSRAANHGSAVYADHVPYVLITCRTC